MVNINNILSLTIYYNRYDIEDLAGDSITNGFTRCIVKL